MKRVTVTLLRHGQTIYNMQKKIQGSSDIELSEIGIQQAEKYKINENNIYDIAIHSPLIRSKQTLESDDFYNLVSTRIKKTNAILNSSSR